MKTLLAIATTTIITLSSPVMACMFDTDCMPGSKCVKASGTIEGVCMGGTFPGNSNDDGDRGSRSYNRDYDDTWNTKGNTCSFDTDCGPGWVCVKGSGIYGTCVKGN